MTIPNADRAIIAPEKLRDYLLNPEHRRGSSKAKLLLSLGYSRDAIDRLEADIRTQHLGEPITGTSESDWGTRYEIRAPIRGPSERVMLFRSVWQIDTGDDTPRFITMYPD